MGNHVGTITVAVRSWEYDNADIQRILAFVYIAGLPRDRKNMRLGRGDFISKIFNHHVGEQFLAHTLDGSFRGIIGHVFEINF